MTTKHESKTPAANESKSGEKPYLVYLILTCLLFGMLVGLAWMALQFDWLPNPR